MVNLTYIDYDQEKRIIYLRWAKPNYTSEIPWVYGVYFGKELSKCNINCKSFTSNNFFSSLAPKIVTKHLTATIGGFEPCKTYKFSTAIIGPLGYGPINTSTPKFYVPLNKLAPPKGLRVRMDDKLNLKIVVSWNASCDEIQEPIGYYVSLKYFFLFFRTSYKTKNKSTCYCTISSL